MQTRIIILAAGKSTRMNGAPKLLFEVGGKPMVVRVVDAAVASGVDAKPLVVIGPNGDGVRAELGERCEYAVQEEQKGTGHAVQCAESALKGIADSVLVLYGDNCMIGPATVWRLAEAHARLAGADGEAREKSHAAITMLTTTVPDFEDWRKPLYDFGRLVRSTDGKLLRSVEKKDASPQELTIKELNPSFCCFDAAWLWENLKKVKPHNAQGEYYLTDLVQIAIEEGAKVETIPVDAREVLGVNTQEQLEIVCKIIPPTSGLF